MPGPVQTEKQYVGDWLAFENDDLHRYSRENVVVAANQTLVSGQVIGKNAAGQIVEYDDVASDGEAATGILVFDVTTGAGETKPGVVIARHARYAAGKLTFKAGLLQPAKDAAAVDLAALGIHPVRVV